MKRDFAGYNEVWAETLGQVGPTRTTLAIDAPSNAHCRRDEGHCAFGRIVPESGDVRP